MAILYKNKFTNSNESHKKICLEFSKICELPLDFSEKVYNRFSTRSDRVLNSKKRHDTEKYKEMFTMAETKEFKAESKRLLE